MFLQWKNEIAKHAPQLKVLIYEGKREHQRSKRDRISSTTGVFLCECVCSCVRVNLLCCIICCCVLLCVGADVKHDFGDSSLFDEKSGSGQVCLLFVSGVCSPIITLL